MTSSRLPVASAPSESGAAVRYVPFGPELDHARHAVVAGRPRPDTALTVSNLPGLRVPASQRADTSAEMVLDLLRSGRAVEALHGVEAVTCDEFHADGLLSLWALLNAERALALAAQVREAAHVGTFGVSQSSEARQFACWVTSFREERGLGDVAESYAAMLPLVESMLVSPREHDLTWIGEYSDVIRAESMLTSGAVEIIDHDGIDLSIMHTPLRLHDITRFTAMRNFRVLTVRTENTYIVEYRLESWVQYASRRPLPRIDLRPLAARLNLFERNPGTWRAEPSAERTPRLLLDTGNGRPAPSAIDAETVIAEVVEFFTANAPRRELQWSAYSPAGAEG